MSTRAFVDLLHDLHHAIARVADEVARDQPQLAEAFRRRAAWIPKPEDVVASAPAAHGSAAATCRELGPLLYHALDEGVLDAAQFDALMLGQRRAERAFRKRDE